WAVLPWPWAFFVPLPLLDAPVDGGVLLAAVLATSVVWPLNVFVGSMAVRVLKRAEVRAAFTSGLPDHRVGSVKHLTAGSSVGGLHKAAPANVDYLHVKLSTGWREYAGLLRCETSVLVLEYLGWGPFYRSKVTEKKIPFNSLGSITLEEKWFTVAVI